MTGAPFGCFQVDEPQARHVLTDQRRACCLTPSDRWCSVRTHTGSTNRRENGMDEASVVVPVDDEHRFGAMIHGSLVEQFKTACDRQGLDPGYVLTKLVHDYAETNNPGPRSVA